MKENKIIFGLKNCHVAKQIETIDSETGITTYTYEAPKPLPGMVKLSMEPQGEDSAFYADDVVYFRTTANNGYSGSIETALIPDWIETEYLGSEKDSKGIQFEKADATDMPKCALLFEFTGDVKAVRHVLYNVTIARPTVEGSTKESSVSPQTATLNYSADPRTDGLVKAKTTADTDTEAYNTWYSEVKQPTAAAA